MPKRIFLFLITLIAVSFTAFFIHLQLLNLQNLIISFKLSHLYIFNFVSCAFICLTAELLAQKLPSQVGYAYLATVFVKMGLFVLVFKNTIFNELGFEMVDRLSMVIPTMLFLIIEAVYCGRLMNKQ